MLPMHNERQCPYLLCGTSQGAGSKIVSGSRVNMADAMEFLQLCEHVLGSHTCWVPQWGALGVVIEVLGLRRSM